MTIGRYLNPGCHQNSLQTLPDGNPGVDPGLKGPS